MTRCPVCSKIIWPWQGVHWVPGPLAYPIHAGCAPIDDDRAVPAVSDYTPPARLVRIGRRSYLAGNRPLLSYAVVEAVLTPVLADLRRQVEQRMLAASDAASKEADEAVAAHRYGKAFAYNAVLSLIDGGGSDGA